ncbi:response regulator transcription factor [Tuwongella immobilis]|uniref:Response regulatory domain-containing protein n=1 Tax=Tuwongella immobilis TaxID=692036 RepID=A0A6C2YHT1_9BACT|nr:response regulator [Tuwongella immobilis]VIP00977.1 family transcriptional regulator : Response regulator OS=Thioflavicoccus mobilis 8321 GN=Thimo_2324 PE=4 SV=1: Response_reg: GerE [Tuwongella immobilis]VTR97372.1 family transcriptional regulator : Response regulator OS=Thioflavicoccus mobilis 8321 GN=Thimo_2324 PE=4 SV=1: Response_reg: GerE [Tuwongella immobilis]
MEPTIYVVDDDEAVRRAIASAGTLLGQRVQGFGSAEAFLAECGSDPIGCLVLDIKMPGLTGLELQRRLADDGITLPIIMISGHADVRIAVESMTLGAMTLLEKPFRLEELLGHLRKALEKDRQDREARSRVADGQARLATLTGKEREVLELIAAGKTNREMAESLGLSVRAVEDRRARLMKKVEARSIAELIRLLTER